MYYYKKAKLPKTTKDFMSYMLSSNSKTKNSGEYAVNQNLTLDPTSVLPIAPSSTTKSSHQKSSSITHIPHSKPRISCTISNTFLPKSSNKIPVYQPSIQMKHQRRASETQFPAQAKIKYEPLKKPIDKVSPRVVASKEITNRSFYKKNANISASFTNHRSFLTKDISLVSSQMHPSKTKCKSKNKQGLAKKKTHTKNNNSVYMKDFEKLMLEKYTAENQSAKRMKVIKAGIPPEMDIQPTAYIIPPQSKKSTKGKKKSINTGEKHAYHKRVKSDQVYSVKLLLRGEDKKNLQTKLLDGNKQPSLTRPATKKHEAITGYSHFAFKKSKGLQNSLIQVSAKNTNFKSENCTPRKLNALKQISYEASCLAQSKKKIDGAGRKDAKIFSEIGYSNIPSDKGKRTANVSMTISNSSQASTAQELFKYRQGLDMSYRGSNVISPNRPINNPDKNRKNLCDYQKEKRSPPSSSNLVIVINDKQDKSKDNANFVKYLKKEEKYEMVSNSGRVPKSNKNAKKASPKKSKPTDIPSSDEKNTFTVDSKTKSKSKKEGEMIEWYLPGNESKLNALQNMPIKKFIVMNKDSNSYRPKDIEEEKKLPLSDSKPKNKSKTIDDRESKPNSQSTTKIISEFYRIGKILGKGAFGKVNLAIDRNTGDLVAIKSINKQYLSDFTSKSKVMQEVAILKKIRHKNIICLKDTFETDSHIIFALELCAGGDLLNYVRKRRKLNENTAKVVFKQILKALEYCHNNGVLHRDIKLDNILLDSKGNVKVGDFGVSKIVNEGEVMHDQCGTPAYIAPEILLDQGYTGFNIDIWSAGVVLYAMLYGTVPFKAHNMKDLHRSIILAKYSLKDTISPEAMDLIQKILEPDPTKRYTIAQILSHQWFVDIDEDIELFNDQEKEKILRDFTYTNTEKYNRNIDNLNMSRDEMSNSCTSETFTEHHLSTQNSLIRNHSTKSVILAPFNSTITEVDAETKQMIRELMEDRK